MRGVSQAVRLGLMLSIGFFLCCLCVSRSASAQAAAFEGNSVEEQQLIEAYENGSLIRLHILAEDDSQEAQGIKLAVRDAILQAFASDLHGDDPQQLYLALQASAKDMRSVAEQTARSMGFDGEVTADVGVFTLPEKQYGSVLLPTGEYRALRITLGVGHGQNWWCVLYPSLCLAVADDEPWRTPPQEEKEEPEDAPLAITWDTERIVSQWLLFSAVP